MLRNLSPCPTAQGADARSNAARNASGLLLSSRANPSNVIRSVYKVIEIVGVSSESREAATKAAVERASKTLRDLRIAEVVKLDVVIEDGKAARFRARLSVSFKYEGED